MFRKPKSAVPLSIIIIIFSAGLYGCSPGGNLPPKENSGTELYREAYAHFEKNEYAPGIYKLRKLLTVKPMSRKLLSVLETAEAAAGVSRQLPAKLRPHPDIFFWTGLSVMCILSALAWIRRGMYKKIVQLSFLPLIITFVGILLSTRVTPIAVTGNSAKMHVVPSSRGTVKLLLPEGTTLAIEEKWEDFYQLRTGDGIIGWLDGTDLIIQE